MICVCTVLFFLKGGIGKFDIIAASDIERLWLLKCLLSFVVLMFVNFTRIKFSLNKVLMFKHAR